MKIVGQMVCGPGEADRWLEESLDDFKRLCDDAVIVTCNSTDKEKNLIKNYGYWQYEDNREWGKNQHRIKTELLRRISILRPDWILSLDTDETVPTLDRNKLEQLTDNRISTYFYVVNLWNDFNHYSEELSFWNVRFYKLPSAGNMQFQNTPLHCGSAPPIAWRQSPRDSYVPHILLHKGLMLPTDRIRKAQRYDIYDPDAQYKGKLYYDSLRRDGKAGPYDQEQVIKKITSFCQKL